jgi:hypothetical protein
MFEHKIHTQRDKTFSGAFDRTEVEAALNAHAAEGVRGMAACGAIHGLQPLEEHEERDRAHPRAALDTTGPAT